MSGCERHIPSVSQLTRRTALTGLALAPIAAPVAAHAKPPKSFRARVDAVARYNVLRMEGGRTVRIADLDIPRPPAGFGLQAQSGLEALALGREVIATPVGEADRYGHLPAHIAVMDDGSTGLSLQGEMLRLGLARVRPRGGNANLSDWFAAEDTARGSSRGLWSDADYAVRAPDADSLAQLMDSFQIVEGIVVATGGPRARTYLNFGSDWRSDFTVVVERKLEKLIPEPVRDLAGARVEARGWIEMVNGPSIWLEDARALRILS